MNSKEEKRTKSTCPKCGKTNSQIWLDENAKAVGIWAKCKKCKQEFELII